MHEELIIPKVIVLAVAGYYAILACRGRIFDFVGAGNVRWVYRSEQPAKFWACTLGWAIVFATALLMLDSDHSSRIRGTLAVTGFALTFVIFFWTRKL